MRTTGAHRQDRRLVGVICGLSGCGNGGSADDRFVRNDGPVSVDVQPHEPFAHKLAEAKRNLASASEEAVTPPYSAQ